MAAGALPVGVAVASVGFMALAAATARASGMFNNPQRLISAGMDKFRKNELRSALEDFDEAFSLDPSIGPFLWQRGLVLYYLGEYEKAAAQFRQDVAVNPNDTEEAVWAFISEARFLGTEKARQQFLQVGRDPRPVMRAVQDCFLNGTPPDNILATSGTSGDHDTFYGLLYTGLWHEAHGNQNEASAALIKSVRTPYAQLSGDYMAALARVHCLQRGWREL